MHQKTITMIIIAIHYVIAIGLFGIVYFSINTGNVILNLLIANLASTAYIYLAGLVLKNASLYDPYWSVMPPVILITFSALWGNLWTLHVMIFNLSILIWAIRLTYNWAKLWQDFSHQDWRYTMIKNKFPKAYPITNLLAIHLFPTLIVFVQLIGGLYFIMLSDGLNVLALMGAVIIWGAVMIQFIADSQMQAFKDKHPKAVMDQGLWALSRHPNYFGEVMVWVGVYVFYLSAARQFDLLVLAPAAMLALFVYISIPMMEKRQLLNKPGYAKYQEHVSMLLPLPQKSGYLVHQNETR